MTMELDNFRKQLAYLVVIFLLFVHPCSPHPDVKPPPIASVFQAGSNYRDIRDASAASSPSAPSIDPTLSVETMNYSSPPAPASFLSQYQLLDRRILASSPDPSAEEPSPSSTPTPESPMSPPATPSEPTPTTPTPPPPATPSVPTPTTPTPPPPATPSELTPTTPTPPPPATPSVPTPTTPTPPPPATPSEPTPTTPTPPPPATPSEPTPTTPTPSPPPTPSEPTPTTSPTASPPASSTQPNFSSPVPTSSKRKTPLIAVAVSVGLGAILCIIGFIIWFLFKRRKMQNLNIETGTSRSEEPIAMFGINAAGAADGGNGSDGSDINPVTQGFSRKLPKRYSFHTLAMATSNFSDKNKLGEGGFGPVFKGILKDDKREVAVKRVSKRAKGATNQYKAEVQILTRLSHRNLVELFGWCDEEGEFLLVYKFMPNGSLNSQLYNNYRLLTWAERYKIVLGLASALNYLHEECEECVLHRDIKPDNVLLDSSFNAKLSDFGLSRFVDHDLGAKNTALAGTMGYMAPEYVQESIASRETDIYSFGVVLLEIACGRPPLAKNADTGMVTMLIDLVWDHYGQKEILKMADKRLNEEFDTQQMECIMTVGLWCAYPFKNERPTIGHVIQVLKFNAPLPELIPTNKPPLFPAFS